MTTTPIGDCAEAPDTVPAAEPTSACVAGAGRPVGMLDEDACWNLTEHFRSVTLLAARDEATGAIRPSPGDVCRWLQEFNAAYAEANERIHPGRLHAYMGRRVLLSGDGLLAEFNGLDRILQVARPCGFALSLALRLEEAAEHALPLATLRSAHSSLRPQLDCTVLDDPTLAPERREALSAALRTLAGTSSDLVLVGAIARLRALGLASTEEFNRGGFTVGAPQTAYRQAHRLHPVSPCHEYLSLHVDAQGDIYPCAGMVGHDAARLGSVQAPFRDLLAVLARTRRNFDVLGPLGPRIPVHVAQQVDRYPVDLCALHRRAVDDLEAL